MNFFTFQGMDSGNSSIEDGLNQCGKCLTPFQRKLLEGSLSKDNLGELQRQRIEIMLLADEGKNQTEICQYLGCSQGTARHWIMIARSGQAHHWQEQPIGRPKLVNDQYLERLKEIVHQSPRELGYPFRRWTAGWLGKHLNKEMGIEISTRHINRLLKELGLSTRLQASLAQKSSSTNDSNNRISIADLSYSPNEATQAFWSFHTLEPQEYS